MQSEITASNRATTASIRRPFRGSMFFDSTRNRYGCQAARVAEWWCHFEAAFNKS
jgi:hypothetical protein